MGVHLEIRLYPRRRSWFAPLQEREFFIENLMVRIHFIIVMIRWTGLAPWIVVCTFCTVTLHSVRGLQGYLAHKKQRNPTTLQEDYAQGHMVVLRGGAVSYKGGTPETDLVRR